MNNMISTVKFSLRTLFKNPGFACVTIVTLAFGIGTITSIFSLVNGILLRPLPYDHPERLVKVYGVWEKGAKEGVSSPDFWDYRRQVKGFESMAAATKFAPYYSLTGFSYPEQLVARLVSSGYLKTLGLHPVAGREFLPQEEARGHALVCMISYELWQKHYNGDPHLAGKTIGLNKVPYEVVGIIPPGFDFLGATDIWLPLELPNLPPFRSVRFLSVVGRLQEGVDIHQAQSEMNTIAQSLESAYPISNKTWRIITSPASDEVVINVRPVLMVLMGAVSFVMLIVIANLSNLMLSWANAHSQETTVRVALGASRGRLIFEVLTFTTVLSLIGGILGCALSISGVALLKKLATVNVPRLNEVAFDWRVLLFGLFVSVLAGLLFGLVPAIRSWRSDLGEALKSRSQTGGPARHRLRSLLMVTEVAFSIMLLLGAGLLIRSLERIQKVDPGFRTSNLMSTRIFLAAARYPTGEKRAEFWRALVEKTEQIPGVEGAAVVTELPLSGQDNPTPFSAMTQWGKSYVLNTRGVSPEYMNVMGIPLKYGRSVSKEDLLTTEHIVVINEAARQAIFGDRDPLGQHLTFDFGPYEATVVGVTGNVHHASLTADPPREAYFPVAQTPLFAYNLIVRTQIAPSSLVNRVRETIWSIDPDQSLGSFSTMEDMLDKDLSRARFPALIVGFFALFALALSAIGLYGTLSYLVTQRTQEIGIRIAIGADKSDVFRMVMMQGARFTLIGVAIGLAGAVILVRLISSLLFGVGLNDPPTYLISMMTIAIISVLASFIPAMRAAQLEPIRALRNE